MTSTRVAVVTGSNKGIGFGIVRTLCKKFEGDVFLTSRDEGRGKAAVEELNKEGLTPKFHQLDINDKSSITNFKTFLESTYGGLDVLVNNAGIAYKRASTVPFPEQAEVSCRTNFWSTLNVCRTLFPILRPHSRVVNMSTITGMYITKCSPAIQERFKDKQLTMEGLEKIMQEFVDAAKSGQEKEAGFPSTAYGMSTIGTTVMSFILDRELATDRREDILVNACCPGYVRTDMSSQKGTKSIDEGADTPAYLALLSPNTKSPKGDMVVDREIHQWG